MRARRGFTLIELIIVMSIILVLASFFLPKFSGYREKAQRLKVIDTGRQIYASAVESYMESNGNFSADEIENNIQQLLGLETVEVISNSGGEIVIQYSVDDKEYTLEFNDISRGFIIRDDSSSQIYPLTNSSQVKLNKDDIFYG